MRAAELSSRRVAVWGLGREGRAAIGFLRKYHPRLPLVLLDDAEDARVPDKFGKDIVYGLGAKGIATSLRDVDVIVKSPGVSLYRREILSAKENGTQVTSLLNLWFAERPRVTTICVTGTKGKSTTASLVAHILTELGQRVAVVGNIGIPITEIDSASTDYAVIEVSSYQAADFDGICDVAVLTSLYPEHIDWHLSVDSYFRDKVNLLSRSRCQIINSEAAATSRPLTTTADPLEILFNIKSGLHPREDQIFEGCEPVGPVRNAYLARPHNLSNLCAALAVIKSLGLDTTMALDASSGFRGLPHRQQEIGEAGGILFVDDSISTIPEATIAALAVYAGRDITIIVGGYDRGIDYAGLIEKVLDGAANAIICLGDSGERIFAEARAALRERRNAACAVYRAQSMEDAVLCAFKVTPSGGAVLLSPAAPSYGSYRDYIERGRDFAAKVGLAAPPGATRAH